MTNFLDSLSLDIIIWKDKRFPSLPQLHVPYTFPVAKGIKSSFLPLDKHFHADLRLASLFESIHFLSFVICYHHCPLESSRKFRVMIKEISDPELEGWNSFVSEILFKSESNWMSIWECCNTYRGHQQPVPQLFLASAGSCQPRPTLEFLSALQTQSGPPPLPQTAR